MNTLLLRSLRKQQKAKAKRRLSWEEKVGEQKDGEKEVCEKSVQNDSSSETLKYLGVGHSTLIRLAPIESFLT